jgi:hypothetical protein
MSKEVVEVLKKRLTKEERQKLIRYSAGVNIDLFHGCRLGVFIIIIPEFYIRFTSEELALIIDLEDNY